MTTLRFSMARSYSAGAVLGLTLVVAACGAGAGPGVPSSLPKSTETGEAFDGLKCNSVRPPTEPDLMGWDPGARAQLSMLRSQGVVAVRYKAQGCNVELEVLPNCIGKGSYRYASYAATDTKIAHNNQELYAELPIGAARLGGKLRGGRSLRTDYMLVGMHALPVGGAYLPESLSGAECERATHVISRVYLGGFAMVAGERSVIDAQASVFSLKVGGGRDAAAEHIAREGIADACEKAQTDGKENAQCAVPLRIGLLAISGRADGGCPAGSTFDGKQCVQRQVVTQIECPAGTELVGTRCVGTVSTKCSDGLHFVSGVGCVASSVASRPVAPSAQAAPTGMVWVPAGTFAMGSEVGRADEKPVHRVSVASFWMDRTEVTVGAYEACTSAGRCSKDVTSQFWDGKDQGGTQWCNWGQADRKNHPINCIDWSDAAAYCNFAGKRLPTEEEWEYAARGIDGRQYPWGNTAPADQLCWSSKRSSCAVGSYPANASPFGSLDMAGNVYEWTASTFNETYNSSRTGTARVFRGGGWAVSDPAQVRSTYRERHKPTHRHGNLGLRCVRAP